MNNKNHQVTAFDHTGQRIFDNTVAGALHKRDAAYSDALEALVPMGGFIFIRDVGGPWSVLWSQDGTEATRLIGDEATAYITEMTP